MMTGVFTDPRWVRFPVIPGHEWAGTVVEVGADVESVDVGDRVVCEGFIVCHRCRLCRSGETHWCERIEALGFTRPGGYAQLVAVPERVVHRLPEHVSFDAGVLVEPASVVLRGLEKARPQAGEAVGVIGVGTLGALASRCCGLHSPSRIVAYGVREEELELARRLGATEVVLSGDGAPGRRRARPRRRDRGRAGRGRARDAALPPRRAGRPARDRRRGAELTLPSDLLVGKDMTLIGSIAYPASTWSRVVGLLAEGVLDLDPIVTHRFPMSDFEEAVRLMDDRRGIVAKIVLEHET